MKLKIIFFTGIFVSIFLLFSLDVSAMDAPAAALKKCSVNQALHRFENKQGDGGKVSWNDSCFLEDEDHAQAQQRRSNIISNELNEFSPGEEEASSDTLQESLYEENIEVEPVVVSPERASEDFLNRQDFLDSRRETFYENDDLGADKDHEGFRFASGEGKPFQAEAGVKAGIRNDYLRWNIAGTSEGSDPNILSELTWEDLNIFQIKTHGRMDFHQLLRLEGSFDYGWIMHGKNQDSDYFLDDRNWEFSRSNNATNDDDVLDLSIGGGLQFLLNDQPVEELEVDQLGVAVLAGYSYHEQNLRMTDGSQTIPATGGFDGLNSTYQAEWDGPWLGVELFGQKNRLRGVCRLEYHWFDYYAEADWNLRDDFAHPKSYEHISDGEGITFIGNARFDINPLWSVDADVDIKSWRAGAGIDRTFFSDGDQSETRLNEVVWISYALMFGLTYHFPY